jgi:hypothetical protein
VNGWENLINTRQSNVDPNALHYGFGLMQFYLQSSKPAILFPVTVNRFENINCNKGHP